MFQPFIDGQADFNLQQSLLLGSLSFQKCIWVMPFHSLMALGFTVHQFRQKSYAPVRPTSQAMGSTQSSKSGCPAPPPGRAPLIVISLNSPLISCRSRLKLLYIESELKSIFPHCLRNCPLVQELSTKILHLFCPVLVPLGLR